MDNLETELATVFNKLKRLRDRMEAMGENDMGVLTEGQAAIFHRATDLVSGLVRHLQS